MDGGEGLVEVSGTETRLVWNGDQCVCRACGASHRAYMEHDEDGSLLVCRLPQERYCYGCGAEIANPPYEPKMIGGTD